MPLNIHQSCITRLEEVLTTAIGVLRVDNGIFLNPRTLSALDPLNSVLPNTARQPIPLSTMLDDRPVSDFVADRIARKLQEVSAYNAETDSIDAPLSAFNEFDRTAEIARSIISEFASLPWNYVFSLRLPKRLSEALAVCFAERSQIDLGGGLCLVRPNEALQAEFAAPQNNTLLALFGGTTHWDTDAIYLRVYQAGYVDKYSASGTSLEAIDKLQTFLGLGAALRLFRYRPTYGLGTFGALRYSYFVHRQSGSDWLFDTSADLETTLADGLEGFDAPDFAGEAFYQRFAENVFNTMQVCFSHPSDATRILRASQWLAGSYASRNETLAFVQAMVAIEILLGDKRTTDMVGIGELLSNRCAYLIGESQSERETVLQDFRDLYSVRSQIVHSGKNRLSFTEKRKYFRLLWICERSIMEEISLLKKNQTT